MKQRLKGALSLLNNDSVEQLIHHFLQLSYRYPLLDTLLVAMYSASESRLECHRFFSPQQQRVETLTVAIEETNHPLVQVLRNGTPMLWGNLNQGVRIENREFRHFVSLLPQNCGLYAVPLFEHQKRVCGVIAAFSVDAAKLSENGGMFSIYSHIFQHRLGKLLELESLKGQLRQIREIFRVQQERGKQLDELLLSLSSTSPVAEKEFAYDYSKIEDLSRAVEEFECAVLRQRQQVYGYDRKKIAASLRLAPRTLAYKLAKYGCQE